jgi:hypothetical protein
MTMFRRAVSTVPPIGLLAAVPMVVAAQEEDAEATPAIPAVFTGHVECGPSIGPSMWQQSGSGSPWIVVPLPAGVGAREPLERFEELGLAVPVVAWSASTPRRSGCGSRAAAIIAALSTVLSRPDRGLVVERRDPVAANGSRHLMTVGRDVAVSSSTSCIAPVTDRRDPRTGRARALRSDRPLP